MTTKEILPRLSEVNPAGPPAGCVVIFRNTTTQDREAVIVVAGVHFFYSDQKGAEQGDYMAGPVRVDLPGGATAPFRSSDPRRHVASLVAAVRVRFGDKDSPKMKEFDYALEVDSKTLLVKPAINHFLAEVRVEFRVKDNVRFTSKDAGDWYELRVAP